MTVLHRPFSGPDDRYTLVTGGAGFIGSNLADRLLTNGEHVLVMDDLSRPGVERNARWLSSVHGSRVRIEQEDCRDFDAVLEAVSGAGSVFHLAAQVAVTTSLSDPVRDFEVNARGTLNVLEAVRRLPRPVPVLFTSTNKVYGALSDVRLRKSKWRVEPEDATLRARGIGETRPLEFHSPYGCSKGAADQYVLDFARTFGIPAIVFRMSCIYGPRQFGNEDQGWVAHFLIRALASEPITIYGDGRQVRDVLYVDDLLDAMLAARANAPALAGTAFNIGGGPRNTTSLLELLERIAALTGRSPRVRFEPPRLADQRYYVSDCTRFSEATGWRPHTPSLEGYRRLFAWLGSGEAPRLPATADARYSADGGAGLSR
jgi:CDP-paratose 2-epimerase